MDLQLILRILCVVVTIVFAQHNPGDRAPAFTLPTLSGPLIYKCLENTNIKPPIIFHEYTSHSGFLDALWNDDASVTELLTHSPKNTQYVFFSSDSDAEKTAKWMKSRIGDVVEKHYSLIKSQRLVEQQGIL